MKNGSFLFVLALAGSLLFAQEFPPPDNEFEVFQNKSGGVTILGYHGSESEVIIPERVGGQQVTVIGARAFFGRGLTRVQIPQGVTAIAYEAFADNELDSVEFPVSLASIEYGAFSGNRLVEVALPENILSVGVRAFAGNRIAVLTIPGRVTFIGVDAFTGNKLERVIMSARRNIFITQGFDRSFVNYYLSTGKRAGLYVCTDRIWTLED
ncbi:MAG: leucine-rich repeat domain-containing protein [Treponema sp.]|jgi:hypothetical protein|nr:leucine-rich repeat domain-containing protein [Treponema sp.]